MVCYCGKQNGTCFDGKFENYINGVLLNYNLGMLDNFLDDYMDSINKCNHLDSEGRMLLVTKVDMLKNRISEDSIGSVEDILDLYGVSKESISSTVRKICKF